MGWQWLGLGEHECVQIFVGKSHENNHMEDHLGIVRITLRLIFW
jgi:hypothetical protein